MLFTDIGETEPTFLKPLKLSSTACCHPNLKRTSTSEIVIKGSLDALAAPTIASILPIFSLWCITAFISFFSYFSFIKSTTSLQDALLTTVIAHELFIVVIADSKHSLKTSKMFL